MPKGRTIIMTPADVANRARHARGFLSAAELVDEFAAEAEIDSATTVIGSLAVLAGIAASDAICGMNLGRRAAGDAHAEALALLAAASAANGSSYRRDLSRLLSQKAGVQYSARTPTRGEALELRRWASRLVIGMESELER